jgi:hypothetical protein
LDEHIASIFTIEEKARQESSSYQAVLAGLLLVLLFQPEKGGDTFPRNIC